MMKGILTVLAGLALGGVGVACADDTNDGRSRPPDEEVLVDNGFESESPSQGWAQSGSSSGGAGGEGMTISARSSAEEAARAIEEADIVKIEGDRLYALSPYGGLAVVDVSVPDRLRLLGRAAVEGKPFEMYVRDGRAHVLVERVPTYVRDDASGTTTRRETSGVFTFDVRAPASMVLTARHEVPGTLADSRVVGDVLYLVTYEDGYCWKCRQKPATIVTSFAIGGSDIVEVDQLAYEAENRSYGWWRRSVVATSKRLYVAGPEWSSSPDAPRASSIIQVVDIGDPRGRLVRGAEIPVAGQIESRWQIDEHRGVLRVVSQYGSGRGSAGAINPRVETFAIHGSSLFTPLGSTELVLPKPESLRSVRFDGTRAYAITAERTDPLFTIDLSNPAAPRQVGQLEMPGFVFHMELRGDRVLGFGYDDTTADARLAVSLFDVSSLSSPTMLSRVSFGGRYGRVGEDQNRVHKAVRVLDELGLVVVPFTSWSSAKGACDGTSGIQLVDYRRDGLSARGLAEQYGAPRRALLVKDRLVGVSERNVTSFDVTERDRPRMTSEIAISTASLGGLAETAKHVAMLTPDERSNSVALALTPRSRASDVTIAGRVSLATLSSHDGYACSDETQWYAAKLFAHGDHVYVAVPRQRWASGSTGKEMLFAAVDVSDPTRPVLAGTTRLLRHLGRGAWFSMAATGAGDEIVQVGSKLAWLDLAEEDSLETDDTLRPRRMLRVVDFADPRAPRSLPPVDLGKSLGALPLVTMGETVLTTRWLPSPRTPGKVQFFVDRIDLSGSEPVRLPSINTPGSLVLADAVSRRFVTVDYREPVSARAPAEPREDARDFLARDPREAFTSEVRDALDRPLPTHLDRRAATQMQPRAIAQRVLVLSDVDGTRVTVRQSLASPTQKIDGVMTTEDRVYLNRGDGHVRTIDKTGQYARYTYESKAAWAIEGIRAGALAITHEWLGDHRIVAARGTKVAVRRGANLTIEDASKDRPRVLTESQLASWEPTHVLLADDRAFCAFGALGLRTLIYGVDEETVRRASRERITAR